MTDDNTPARPESLTSMPDVSSPPDTNAADTPEFNPALRQRVCSYGWTAERQRLFIAELADTGSVTSAATAVGMSERGAYKLRRSAAGKSFARAWEMAIAQATRRLTDIAFERAISGVQEPVYDRDGNLTAIKRKLNDRLLMFLLRHHRRDVYGTGMDRVLNMADRAEADKWNEGISPVPDAMKTLKHSDIPLGEDDYGLESEEEYDADYAGSGSISNKGKNPT